ncbi:MAG: carbohydrate kinase family protein [Acidobacteriota bacterium]
MAKRPLALVLGDINRDLFVRLRSFPRRGRDNPAETAIRALGGSAANTAAVLASLRIPTGVIGRVGQDSEGKALLREMAEAGIQTRAVQRDPERPTGICIIPVTGDGERTLIGVRGANAALGRDRLVESLDGIRHLHVSGYTLLQPRSRQVAMEALRTAREKGVTTSLDFGWLAVVNVPGSIRQALAHVSLALPTAAELRAAFGIRRLGEAAEKALALGVDQVAATLGAGGCRVFASGLSFRVPPFEARTVNTCGAGDAFNAGYLYGLLHDARPQVCGILGNAAGAAAVRSEWLAQALDRATLARILLHAEKTALARRLGSALGEAMALVSGRSSRRRPSS